MPTSAMSQESKKPSVKKEKRKMKERKKERAGTVIFCGGKGYEVENVLGSGGFGDVYKVCLTKNREKKFAMKTERFDVLDEKQRRMIVETSVFEACQEERATDKTHFAKMVEFGKTDEFNFLIMEIVGPNLFDFRRKTMKGTTSPRTIIEVARQTLKAIESLHELGWLHRDLKPHNFAIGLPPRDATIFILDFGMARPYREKDGRIRAPRRSVPWKGTPRYASARALLCEEQSRRDDLVSWCFMILEYYRPANLMWSFGNFDKNLIIQTKGFVISSPEVFVEKKQLKMPARFAELLTMTNALTFTANPNYDAMRRILDDIVKDEKIDMSLPIDWIAHSPFGDAEKDKLKAPSDGAVTKKDPDVNEQTKMVDAKRKQLEDDMIKMFKDAGQPKTREEVREALDKREEELTKKLLRRARGTKEDDGNQGGKKSPPKVDRRTRKTNEKKSPPKVASPEAAKAADSVAKDAVNKKAFPETVKAAAPEAKDAANKKTEAITAAAPEAKDAVNKKASPETVKDAAPEAKDAANKK
uniref:Protein kinase domain-containing protein n=1 Tax=Pristionchus pacificus TaxID=54126 RepID=A0A8R1UI97_PRIPA